MSYKPRFKPEDLLLDKKKTGEPPPGNKVPYLYDEDTKLAVNVALATNRPLLLSGDPGCGKSSLAGDVAWLLDRRFEDRVITSRVTGQDLKWRFDAVRRLADVQAIKAGDVVKLDDSKYIEPGVLWRAFNRGQTLAYGPVRQDPDSADVRKAVVVLIDEIDKADPDLPNDLLVTLDERRFTVDDVGADVKAVEGLDLLVVVTTNGERALPPAFVRRCVTHHMENPKGQRLIDIAKRHFSEEDDLFLGAVEAAASSIAATAAKERRRPPSVAEYLDAVRALTTLNVRDPQSPQWTRIANATLLKADHSGGSRV